jgi:hypothetical protein
MAANESEGRFEVVAPMGEQLTEAFQPAPALAELSGKRIGFLWDLLFKGDFVYDEMADEMTGTHDGMTFVGFETFGDIHGGDEHQVMADLPGLLRQHRIDAAVVGVGA